MRETSGSVRLLIMAVLAIIAGVALAVVLQQAGVWPLDRLMLFGLPGLMVVITLLLCRGGGLRPSTVVVVIVIIIAILLLGFGATGLASVGEQGQLNGGCTVSATSDIDATSVIDTSRSNPFDVDPNGSLSWKAQSPTPITDHTWKIWVDVGGFQVVVADGGDPNTGKSMSNEGTETVSTYVDYLEQATGTKIVGIYKVGGDIAGNGGACDGFGFVRVKASFLEGPIALAAGIVFIVLLIIIVVVCLTGRRRRIEQRIEV